jgi:hypothetical protein
MKRAKGDVVAIRGANVAAALRGVLERAEKGEIISVAMVYETTETMGHAVSWERDVDLVALVGAIELLKHRLIVAQEDVDDEDEENDKA